MATAQSSTQVLRLPALPIGRLWKRATVKRAFAGHRLYQLGVLITLFWVGVALLAPWIAPYSPTQGEAALAQGSPSLSHLFGLDKYGRDIFTRVVYGSRYDLCIAVTVVGCSLGRGNVHWQHIGVPGWENGSPDYAHHGYAAGLSEFCPGPGLCGGV